MTITTYEAADLLFGGTETVHKITSSHALMALHPPDEVHFNAGREGGITLMAREGDEGAAALVYLSFADVRELIAELQALLPPVEAQQ